MGIHEATLRHHAVLILGAMYLGKDIDVHLHLVIDELKE